MTINEIRTDINKISHDLERLIGQIDCGEDLKKDYTKQGNKITLNSLRYKETKEQKQSE